MKDKHLLFSIGKDQFEFQTFSSGGPGGSKKNATKNGVRCIHKISGAVGKASENREQHSNKELAFERCANSPVFKSWHRVEVARRLGILKSVEEAVERQMRSENIKIECLDSR